MLPTFGVYSEHPLLFGGIIPCILTFCSYLKMDIIIFQLSQNQVMKISRPELCTHATFIHRILLILFVVMIVCTFNRGRREFGIDCRTDSCNSGKGWKYLDKMKVRRRGARRSDNGCIGRLLEWTCSWQWNLDQAKVLITNP